MKISTLFVGLCSQSYKRLQEKDHECQDYMFPLLSCSSRPDNSNSKLTNGINGKKVIFSRF